MLLVDLDLVEVWLRIGRNNSVSCRVRRGTTDDEAGDIDAEGTARCVTIWVQCRMCLGEQLEGVYEWCIS